MTSSACSSNDGGIVSQRLGSLQIDGRYVLCWCLHGELGGPGSTQNAIDIRRCLSGLIHKVGTVGDQTTGSNVVSEQIDRWQAILRCECNNEVAVQAGRATRQDEQATIWRGGEGREDALDIRRVFHEAGRKLHRELWDRGLSGAQKVIVGRGRGVHEEG